MNENGVENGDVVGVSHVVTRAKYMILETHAKSARYMILETHVVALRGCL